MKTAERRWQVHNKFTVKPRQATDKRLLATSLQQVRSSVETSRRQAGDRQEQVYNKFTIGSQQCRDKQATSGRRAGSRQARSCWRQVHSSVETSKRQAGDRQEVVSDKFTTSLQQVHNGWQQAGDRQGYGKVEVVVNKLDRVTTGSRLLATSLRQVRSMVETSMRQRGDRQSDGRQVHNKFAAVSKQAGDR